VKAISSGDMNPYIREIAEEIDRFTMDCSLLVCGFDDKKDPYILLVENPGIVVNMSTTGFHAIGSGWDKAVSRLLFSGFRRKHPLHRTLYDCFDAKANAEMAYGVGYSWDGAIVTPTGTKDVPGKIKLLIERVWSQHTRSPFEKYNKKEDGPLPPKQWKEQMEDFTGVAMKDLLGSKRTVKEVDNAS
jgi:hypothetical protein